MGTSGRIEIRVCHDIPVLQAGLMATLAMHGDLVCHPGSVTLPVRGSGAGPDVLVTDPAQGLDVASAGASWPGPHRPRVLIVTRSERDCDLRTALSRGVQGVLLLDDTPDHLLPAIRALHLGGRFLGPRVAACLAEQVALERLTQREAAVLALVGDGLCNKRVASQLGITVGTVKSHLRSAFGKLGASSRTQAMVIAQRRGLLNLGAAASRH